MHETPHFGTRQSAKAKWNQPWQQEHLSQTGISSFSPKSHLQPCAKEIFGYAKARLSDQPLQTKMWLNICSSPEWSSRATHLLLPLLPRQHQAKSSSLSSWGWVDTLLTACPRAFLAGGIRSQLHYFKPSGSSFSLGRFTGCPVK